MPRRPQLGHDRRHELASALVVLGVLGFAVVMLALKPWRAAIDLRVDDAGVPAGPVVATGSWAGHDGFDVAGAVELTTKAVRLVDFAVEATPAAHVVLTTGDATLDLGALRGNVGQLVYPLPAGTAATAFDAVEIRDPVIGGVIGTAALDPVVDEAPQAS